MSKDFFTEFKEKIVGNENWQSWNLEEIKEEAPVVEPLAIEHIDSEDIEDAEIIIDPAEAAREAAYEEGLEKGKKEGYDAGLAEGREEGIRLAKEEFETEKQVLLSELRNDAEKIVKSFNIITADHLSHDIVDSLTNLALQAGQKLARNAFDKKPEEINQIIRELIHSDPVLNNNPRVWVNPKDLELLANDVQPELEMHGWTLLADEDITRGGFKVTSRGGEFDSTWEKRWSMISEGLLD